MLFKLGKTSPFALTWTKESFFRLAVTVLPLLIFFIVLWVTLVHVYSTLNLWELLRQNVQMRPFLASCMHKLSNDVSHILMPNRMKASQIFNLSDNNFKFTDNF